MPLIRDWTDSLTVDALDAHGERFFTRLLMKVDDYGRTLAEPRLLKSRLFPLKTDIRETDISRWLAVCQKAGLLRFYVDGRGRTILEVFKYGQRKKFMKSEYDPPEDQQFLPLAHDRMKAVLRPSDFKKYPPTKEVEVEEKGKQAVPAPSQKICLNTISVPKAGRELWQLLNDEKTIKTRLSSERESTKPDPGLVDVLRTQLKAVRDEIKNLKP